MNSPAKKIFDSIEKYKDLENLVNQEYESIYLECKAPSKLNRDVISNITKLVSSFSNTQGGVIIMGMSTTKKAATGLDLITQIEPMGNLNKIARQLENKIPITTYPSITRFEIKTIKKKNTDTKGVIMIYIPRNESGPVQSTKDNLFYIRSGDSNTKAPYEIIRSLFSATETPDIGILFSKEIIKLDKNNSWDIPIIIKNESPAVGKHIKISVTILNPESCEIIGSNQQLKDGSSTNPGKKIFIANYNDVLHKKFPTALGSIIVSMKGKKKKLILEFNIFCDKMRAKKIVVDLQMKKKFEVRLKKEEHLY